MQNLRKRLLLLSFIFLVLFSLSVSADTRAEYDRYVATYKSYQNAIIEKKSEAEIKELLSDFQSAKAAYENISGKGQDSAAQEIVDAANAEVPSSSDLEVQTTTNTEITTQTTQISNLPATLQKIIKRLWSPEYRTSPDKNIKLLENYINSESDSKYADIARYEMAKAYEILKNDTKTSSEILTDIATRNPNSEIGQIAKERVNHLVAEQKYVQWKQALQTSFDEKEASYAKYKDTSWWALPVKGTRWVGYLSKLREFDNYQNDFTTFQIWHEKVSASFVPPVEITFDMFKAESSIYNASETSEVELCYQNSRAWYARWKLLNEARHSIDVQYYIVDDDIFGMSLMGALLKKAKEGITINLMMDSRGTKGFTKKLQGQDYMQELVAYPNVTVKVFNPLHTNLLTALGDIRRLTSSNHDKIFIVDDEYCIIGGRNVSMNYFIDPEDYPSAYRDCDVVIHSTSVALQLKEAFSEEFTKLSTFSIAEELWGNIDIMSEPMNAAYWAMDSHLRNEVYQEPKDAESKFKKALITFNEELSSYQNLTKYTGYQLLESSIEAPVKIIDKHSMNGPKNDITDQMVKYIDGSTSEVILQNPYVVLTERMFNALERAGKRGVSVIIHTNSPYSTDSLATQAMFYADWKKILSKIKGSRIFVYVGERKLHAKNWLFDSKIGVVGTYNLDYISEQINSEVVAAVKSTEFAKQLREGMMTDIQQSKEYKVSIDEEGNVEAVVGPDDYQGKNFWLLKLLSKLTAAKTLI